MNLSVSVNSIQNVLGRSNSLSHPKPYQGKYDRLQAGVLFSKYDSAAVVLVQSPAFSLVGPNDQ